MRARRLVSVVRPRARDVARAEGASKGRRSSELELESTLRIMLQQFKPRGREKSRYRYRCTRACCAWVLFVCILLTGIDRRRAGGLSHCPGHGSNVLTTARERLPIASGSLGEGLGAARHAGAGSQSFR